MAEFQVTHDGVSKEEKEKMIEDYLKKHGLYIIDAPKVHHREANIMDDDIRYPLIDEDDFNKNNNVESTSESKVLFDFDTLETNPLKNINKYDNNFVKITHHNSVEFEYLDGCKRSGLVSYAVGVKTYDIGIVRPGTGLVNKTIAQGDILSIATYDGGSFKVFTGKILDFAEHNTPDSYAYNSPQHYTMKIAIDTSKAFSSKIELIDINTVIDIREKDYVYDFSIYGKDIKKIYTDWVQEDIMKKPNTIAPSDNLKYTRPLPPISGDFSCIDRNEIRVIYNKKYTFTALSGAQIIKYPWDYDVLTVLDLDNTLVYGHFIDGVFYSIPLDYTTENDNIRKPVFTQILFNGVDYSIYYEKDITRYDQITIPNKNTQYIAVATTQLNSSQLHGNKGYEIVDNKLYKQFDSDTYYLHILNNNDLGYYTLIRVSKAVADLLMRK